MALVVALALITILSVVLTLRKKKMIYLTLPIVTLFGFALVKIWMVPMPFWDTVKFIFDLRG
ncbi:hypothetical protein [Halobacillus sp. Marseille-Q1614]|uniref:hypothetical protein n=1 Tax=Halobacillus sp. Marseille-Q1614 TaxID=2709134 RepID=UPI00156D922F|nr:hypothetical protein [Halobacillus sp. Marseille-Q1614]